MRGSPSGRRAWPCFSSSLGSSSSGSASATAVAPRARVAPSPAAASARTTRGLVRSRARAFCALACCSRHAPSAPAAPRAGDTTAWCNSRAIQWKPSSLASSAVAANSVPATIHEPTAPSAEWSASPAANPQPPASTQRSSPPSPSSVHTSNTSSTPTSEVTASGRTSALRSRFHAHTPASTGTPKAAIRPSAHTSPNASVAPTGPHALAAVHGA